MPLVLAAYLAFLGGVVFAASGVAWWPLAVGLTIGGLAAAWARQSAVPAALAALALSGLLLARADGAQRARCVAGALADTAWRVRLESAARPGDLVRGRLDGGACRVIVSIAVAEGRAERGALVRVRASAGAGQGRVPVRLSDASVRMLAGPGWLDRLRTRSRERVQELYGADDALPAALLLADTDGIGPELRARFADAGLVHLLAISGLHVGLVAAALELVLRLLRLSRGGATLGAALGSLAYVALLGFPPAALRAGAMLAVMALCRLGQRPTSPWAVLAVGATIPLAGGLQVAGAVGYQLSVLGVAALIAGGRVGRRWHALAVLRGWRGELARGLLTSTAATVASAPLVAWHFGRLSLVGPLANLVAGPVVAFLQPLLFLSLVLAPARGVAMVAADAARPVLLLLDRVAATAASLPGAGIEVAPALATALCGGVIIGALLVASSAVFPARALLVGATAAVTALWLPLAPVRRHEMELHLIDVGQGDAIALRTPAGRWIVVDAGRIWRGGDAGRRTLVPYLSRRGGEVAAFVLSHPHADHVGGAATLLRLLHPREYWDAGYAAGGDAYRQSLLAARTGHIRWRRVHPRDSLVLDGVTVRFLAPDSAWTASLHDANLASTIALVQFGAVRFLLTGDAEAPEEAWLLAHAGAGALRADVLKVAHHGSATSTTPPFLAAVNPRLALISVGADNDYGHPSAGVVARLLAAGAVPLRTDRLGTVVLRTDGRAITVQTATDRWNVPPRSPP